MVEPSTPQAPAAPETQTPPIDAVASRNEGNGGVLSKKQRKKQRRAEQDPVELAERQNKRRKAKKDAKNAGRFIAEAPAYSFANGYRMVEPYVYEFRAFAKQRWFKRELLEIFTTEFGAYSPDYYVRDLSRDGVWQLAIASGRILVNHQVVAPDTVIKNGDLIIHKAHRHEPPVSGEEVAVVYEDEDLVRTQPANHFLSAPVLVDRCLRELPLPLFCLLLEQIVVSKPPSIPTHPCGAYRHNSLHSIVQANRPDLPQLNIRQASKTYLARVRGQFPSALGSAIQEQLASEAKAKCAASIITFPDEDTILINCPLRCLSARDGVWECHEEGKPSETLVRLVRTDNCTSLLQCKPITGRTHQIRLHLQLLGFPIANDPCYGGELHFGESVARTEEIAAAKRLKAERPVKDPVDFSTPRKETESEDEFMRRTCTWCFVGEAEAFNETQLHCSKIWLHALEYKLDGQEFRVPEPSWAAPSTEY
ncbi:hypothetical protein BBJ28_00009137 [Nothophytophthora sp. Chile5]|nr:hypothetical protein BBJ28_00009137 [Nothophytophthora sp. Chile5]